MPRTANKALHTPIGQAALHIECGSDLPPPAVQSHLVSGARRTIIASSHTEEQYPPKYQTDGSLRGNLRFALRNEPLDLGIIYAALTAIGADNLENWVREEPTGAYSRRAWFLYETLTGNTLDLEPVRTGGYIDALDEKRHFTAAPVNSARHRVRDNLLGFGALCPTLRKTPRLIARIQERYDTLIKTLTGAYPPAMLARAIDYLYTKETRSSFAIEGERPGAQREARFLDALHSVSYFIPTKYELIRLQQQIVDWRYAAQDWRYVQNFVGRTTRHFGEKIDFICPRPEDVPILMDGWEALTKRLLQSPHLDAVLAAAVSAFAFVFIHPFEDGNGRIHRYLIHYVLDQRGFNPPKIIFPVSAAILRQRVSYDQALEAFSRPLLKAIDWEYTEDHTVVVRGGTRDLYRFFDATPQAEFLYDRVAETVTEDFKGELDFLVAYDAAFSAVQRIVDIPDRRLALLIRLYLQNGNRISRSKRSLFAELTDDEMNRIEGAISDAMAEASPAGNTQIGV